jgi:hypothetical protein
MTRPPNGVIKADGWARHQWLTPVILATSEAEIRRIEGQGQAWQTVEETPISKITRAEWNGGVAQEVEHLLCKPLKKCGVVGGASAINHSHSQRAWSLGKTSTSKNTRS